MYVCGLNKEICGAIKSIICAILSVVLFTSFVALELNIYVWSDSAAGGGGSAAEIGCLCCNPILSSLQVLLLS